MELSVREAAKLLGVTEQSVYQWVGDGSLQGHRVNGQYRFNRAELLEFATSHRMAPSPQLFEKPGEPAPQMPELARALERGGITRGLRAGCKREVLEAIVGRLTLLDDEDRRLLLPVLLAREELASTGVGDGIAIPHVRGPIVLRIVEPVLTLTFLDEPIEFGSVDGLPVHALFLLVCPTVRAHLQFLSRLAFCLRKPDFKQAVQRQADSGTIFAALRRLEQELVTTSGSKDRAKG